MADLVQLKRSATASKIPLTTDLSLGEIAINTYDGKLYIKKDDGAESIVEIGGGSGGEWIVSGTDLLQVTAGLTDIYMSDATTDATPLAQALHGQGGSGTDIVGAALTIAGGRGTGSAAGGDIIFQVTEDGAGSGATLRTLVTALTISAASKQVLLPSVNIAQTPSLAFGDGDTGFYEQSDDAIRLSIATTSSYVFDATGIRTVQSSGAALMYASSSSTVAGFAFGTDNGLGIGKGGTDILSFITDSTEAVRIDASQNVSLGGGAPEVWIAGFTALEIGGTASIVAQTGEAVSQTLLLNQNAW